MSRAIPSRGQITLLRAKTDCLRPQQAFLLGEVWTSAWGASVQRTSLFAEDTKDRKIFREKIRDFFTEQLLNRYENKCPEEQHYQNIDDLVKFGTTALPAVLCDGSYRYGVAQKLLNLTLKYHWCLGRIPEPPHCPVDRIVIDKTHLRGKVNWTEITDHQQYRVVIAAIKKVAGRKSLARWELMNYSRR